MTPVFGLVCLLLFSSSRFALAQPCPAAPGAARAACFCQSVTVYQYYADTLNGCTGAMWCYGPGQSAYLTCSSGLLFNEALQYCDWAANVASKCSAPTPTSPTPSPSPSPKSPSPSPKLISPSPSPKLSPSPSPKPSTTPSPSPKPTSSSPSPAPRSSPSPSPAPAGTKTLPSGPLVVAYYQSWSAPWASTGSALDLAKIPSYVNVVVVSFAQPDCTYTKGSLSLSGTGLQFSSDGPTVKAAIAALKAAQPNTRVMLAVGGATFTNFAALKTTCIKDIVDDFGFDGVDLDYEPTNSNCVVGTNSVSCATDAESVSVTTALRNALPKGRYLLSTASWHVGCYGEGAFKAAQPSSAYTGVNLAMAKSAAGQQLDLVSIMAYDAGNKASTGFDWSESYRAHRAVWPTQAIAIGVEIPPEAWGGNVIVLQEVTTRATYARDLAGSAPYGLMLWSIHKSGCPSAQQITSAACTAFNMPGCSAPLPQPQSSCPTPSPTPTATPSPSPKPASSPRASPVPSSSPTPPISSPAPSPSPQLPVGISPSPSPATGGGGSGCKVTAAPGGLCGATNGGICCPSGQCCSAYGYCGITTAHCGTGCQAAFGACTGSPTPSPTPPAAASPSPVVPVVSSPAPGSSPAPPSGGSGNGSVSDFITAAQFEQIFLHRNDPACASKGFYTYNAFVTAAAAFPGFGTASADPAVNKRELAAFLGQISHETTGGWPTAPDGPYSWGLCWIVEGGVIPPTAPYCAATPEYPCAAGKLYYGRGPIQLSWNYNYIQAGAALGFDGLNKPELVAQDPVLSFKTAIWFWMTPQAPKPSCHDVMVGTWTPTAADTAAGRVAGYGLTTNIINGGLECNINTPLAQEVDRIGYYKRYCDIFGVTYGSNLDCSKQRSF